MSSRRRAKTYMDTETENELSEENLYMRAVEHWSVRELEELHDLLDYCKKEGYSQQLISAIENMYGN